MAINHVVGRHSVRHGWNPGHDDEWQFRKTLDKADRDIFDYELDDKHRKYYVDRWIKRGRKPKEAKLVTHDEALLGVVGDMVSNAG